MIDESDEWDMWELLRDGEAPPMSFGIMPPLENDPDKPLIDSIADQLRMWHHHTGEIQSKSILNQMFQERAQDLIRMVREHDKKEASRSRP